MKRNFISKTVAALLSAAALMTTVACSNGTSASSPASSTEASSQLASNANAPSKKPSGDPVKLVFATDQVGSSNYNIAAGIANMWLDYLPEGSSIDVQPISPGNMGAPYLFKSETADISFVNGAPAKWAYEDGTLGKDPTQEFRALAGHLTNVSAVNFLTQDFIDQYHVDTIEEVIQNKLPIRIGVSPLGSMDYQCVELLFQHLGIKDSDIKAWGGDIIHGSGSDLSNLLKDGKLDMILDHTSAQSSSMQQNSMTCNLHFTQWSDDTLDWFCKEQGFERITIPANTFKGQDQEIVDAGTPDCLFVSKNMNDDVAYDLVKGLCEQRDYLVSQYASISPFDPSTAWESSKVGGVPVHPGAETYYKEKGYMK